jgi:hypothetical protein
MIKGDEGDAIVLMFSITSDRVKTPQRVIGAKLPPDRRLLFGLSQKRRMRWTYGVKN